MKTVLFVAAEAHPFITTGGLGDAVGALLRELKEQGINVGIILPEHDKIPAHWREKMIFVKAITVPVGWRKKYCGIKKLVLKGLTYYFIDNEDYFKRPGLYGYADDAERFTYFCKAVLASLPYLDFQPEILHCHDWHTAILPVLLKGHYQRKNLYSNLRTMLTIHSIEYQGIFKPSVVEDLLELDPKEYFTSGSLEFYGLVNFLKAGIVYADTITTISPNHAQEILTADKGRGLDGVLRQRQDVIFGIMNGIDNESYDPATDKAVFANYSWSSPSRKHINKLELQKYLGLPVNSAVPMFGLIARYATRGFGLVIKVIDNLLLADLQLVVLSSGDSEHEDAFRVAVHHYPNKLSVTSYFEENLARRIFAASDLYLVPDLNPGCTSQMIALRYGSIPVVRQEQGQQNIVVPYNEVTKDGNGFAFTERGAQDLLSTLRRAIGYYHDSSVWSQILVSAMKTDVSWRSPAVEYSRLYERVAK